MIISGASQWTDCHDFSQRVVDCGVGLKLTQTIPYIDENEAIPKLRRLLEDESFREKAKYWGGQMKKAGGTQAAAKALIQGVKNNNTHVL